MRKPAIRVTERIGPVTTSGPTPTLSGTAGGGGAHNNLHPYHAITMIYAGV